jgi:dephospho-CoA kinase
VRTHSIAVVGRPAAGKTTVAGIVSRVSGLRRISVGALLLNVLKAEGVTIATQADIGPTYLSRHTARDLDIVIADAVRDAGEPAIVDAVRLFDTAERMKRRGVKIWFVDAPEAERVSRLRDRVTAEDLSEVRRVLRQYEMFNAEQDAIRQIADVVLLNDGELADLERAVIDELAGPQHSVT